MPKRFEFLVVGVLLVGLVTGSILVQRKTTPPPSLASGCRCVDDGMCSSGENTIPNISCDDNKNGFGTACCGNAPAESAPPTTSCDPNQQSDANGNTGCGDAGQGYCTRCNGNQVEYFCKPSAIASGAGCIAPASQSSEGTSASNWQNCNPNPAGTQYGVCSGNSQYACGSDFRETKCVNNHWESTGNCCQTPGDIAPPPPATTDTTTSTETTQTASSIAQTARASGKCDTNLGLCQAFDPKTGEFTGWVPATKAVFCDYNCVLAARMNVVVGSSYHTIDIGGKQYQAYDLTGDTQTLSLNDKSLDVAAIKKAADANQVIIDANGYANPNLTADQVADLQKRVDTFNSQQIAVQQAILDDIKTQGQDPSLNKNFKYLSSENQSSVTTSYQETVQTQAESNSRINTILAQLQKNNGSIPTIASVENDISPNIFSFPAGTTQDEINQAKSIYNLQKTQQTAYAQITGDESRRLQQECYVSNNDKSCIQWSQQFGQYTSSLTPEQLSQAKVQNVSIIAADNRSQKNDIFKNSGLDANQIQLAQTQYDVYVDKQDRFLIVQTGSQAQILSACRDYSDANCDNVNLAINTLLGDFSSEEASTARSGREQYLANQAAKAALDLAKYTAQTNTNGTQSPDAAEANQSAFLNKTLANLNSFSPNLTSSFDTSLTNINVSTYLQPSLDQKAANAANGIGGSTVFYCNEVNVQLRSANQSALSCADKPDSNYLPGLTATQSLIKVSSYPETQQALAAQYIQQSLTSLAVETARSNPMLNVNSTLENQYLLIAADPTSGENQSLISQLATALGVQITAQTQNALNSNYYSNLISTYYSDDTHACSYINSDLLIADSTDPVAANCYQLQQKISSIGSSLTSQQRDSAMVLTATRVASNLNQASYNIDQTIQKMISENNLSANFGQTVDQQLLASTGLSRKDWDDYRTLTNNLVFQSMPTNIQQNVIADINAGKTKPSEAYANLINSSIVNADNFTRATVALNIIGQGSLFRNIEDELQQTQDMRSSLDNLSPIARISTAGTADWLDDNFGDTHGLSFSAAAQTAQSLCSVLSFGVLTPICNAGDFTVSAESGSRAIITTATDLLSGQTSLSDLTNNLYTNQYWAFKDSEFQVGRTAIAAGAPIAAIIAPAVVTPFFALGGLISSIPTALTFGQTAFGTYATVGSLGNTAEVCTFRPGMDKVGCGIAVGNTAYMALTTFTGVMQGTVSLQQARTINAINNGVKSSISTSEMNSLLVQQAKINPLFTSSPELGFITSLTGGATFGTQAIVSCSRYFTDPQNADLASCIVSAGMGLAQLTQTGLNITQPLFKNNTGLYSFVSEKSALVGELSDQLDAIASCVDLRFNSSDQTQRFNPFECALGLYDGFGDNLSSTHTTNENYSSDTSNAWNTYLTSQAAYLANPSSENKAAYQIATNIAFEQLRAVYSFPELNPIGAKPLLSEVNLQSQLDLFFSLNPTNPTYSQTLNNTVKAIKEYQYDTFLVHSTQNVPALQTARNEFTNTMGKPNLTTVEADIARRQFDGDILVSQAQTPDQKQAVAQKLTQNLTNLTATRDKLTRDRDAFNTAAKDLVIQNPNNVDLALEYNQKAKLIGNSLNSLDDAIGHIHSSLASLDTTPVAVTPGEDSLAGKLFDSVGQTVDNIPCILRDYSIVSPALAAGAKAPCGSFSIKTNPTIIAGLGKIYLNNDQTIRISDIKLGKYIGAGVGQSVEINAESGEPVMVKLISYQNGVATVSVDNKPQVSISRTLQDVWFSKTQPTPNKFVLEQPLENGTPRGTVQLYEKTYGNIPDKLNIPNPQIIHPIQTEIINAAKKITLNQGSPQKIVNGLVKKIKAQQVNVYIYNEEQMTLLEDILRQQPNTPIPEIATTIERATKNGTLPKSRFDSKNPPADGTTIGSSYSSGKSTTGIFLLSAEGYAKFYKSGSTIDGYVILLQKLGHEMGHAQDRVLFGLKSGVVNDWITEIRQKSFNAQFWNAINKTSPSIDAKKLQDFYERFVSETLTRTRYQFTTVGKPVAFNSGVTLQDITLSIASVVNKIAPSSTWAKAVDNLATGNWSQIWQDITSPQPKPIPTQPQNPIFNDAIAVYQELNNPIKNIQTDEQQRISDLADFVYFLNSREVISLTGDTNQRQEVISTALAKRQQDAQRISSLLASSLAAHDLMSKKYGGLIISDPTQIDIGSLIVSIVDPNTMQKINAGNPLAFINPKYGVLVISQTALSSPEDIRRVLDHETSHLMYDPSYRSTLKTQAQKYFGADRYKGYVRLINEGLTELRTYYSRPSAYASKGQFFDLLSPEFATGMEIFDTDIRNNLERQGLTSNEIDQLLLSVGANGLNPLVEKLGGWDNFFKFFEPLSQEARSLDPSIKESPTSLPILLPLVSGAVSPLFPPIAHILATNPLLISQINWYWNNRGLVASRLFDTLIRQPAGWTIDRVVNIVTYPQRFNNNSSVKTTFSISFMNWSNARNTLSRVLWDMLYGNNLPEFINTNPQWYTHRDKDTYLATLFPDERSKTTGFNVWKPGEATPLELKRVHSDLNQGDFLTLLYELKPVISATKLFGGSNRFFGPKSVIVDLGAGEGRASYQLSQRYPDATFVAIDFGYQTKNVVQFPNLELVGKAQFVKDNWDTLDTLPDDSVDSVMSVQGAFRWGNENKVAEAITRISKPGAVVRGDTHNNEFAVTSAFQSRGWTVYEGDGVFIAQLTDKKVHSTNDTATSDLSSNPQLQTPTLSGPGQTLRQVRFDSQSGKVFELDGTEITNLAPNVVIDDRKAPLILQDGEWKPLQEGTGGGGDGKRSFRNSLAEVPDFLSSAHHMFYRINPKGELTLEKADQIAKSINIERSRSNTPIIIGLLQNRQSGSNLSGDDIVMLVSSLYVNDPQAAVNDGVVDELTNMIQNPKNYNDIYSSAEALLTIGVNLETIRTILEYNLTNPNQIDPDITIASINVLSKIGNPLSIQPILSYFWQQDERIRFAAVLAIGDFRDPSVIPYLDQFVKSSLASLKARQIKTEAEYTQATTQFNREMEAVLDSLSNIPGPDVIDIAKLLYQKAVLQTQSLALIFSRNQSLGRDIAFEDLKIRISDWLGFKRDLFASLNRLIGALTAIDKAKIKDDRIGQLIISNHLDQDRYIALSDAAKKLLYPPQSSTPTQPQTTTFQSNAGPAPTLSGLGQPLLEKLGLQYTDSTGVTHWRWPFTNSASSQSYQPLLSVYNTALSQLEDTPLTQNGVVITPDNPAHPAALIAAGNIEGAIHEIRGMDQTELTSAVTTLYDNLSKISAVPNTPAITKNVPLKYEDPPSSLPPIKDGDIRLYRGVKSRAMTTEFSLGMTAEEQTRWNQLIDKIVNGGTLSSEEIDFMTKNKNIVFANEGRWYSGDYSSAKHYAGNEGTVFYVDLQRNEAEKYVMQTTWLSNGHIADNFLVPSDLHRQLAQPISAEITSNPPTLSGPGQTPEIPQIISDVHTKVQSELAQLKTKQEIIDYITHDLESMGVEIRNGTPRVATKGSDKMTDIKSMAEIYIQTDWKRAAVTAHEWEHIRQVKALLDAGFPTSLMNDNQLLTQIESATYATTIKLAYSVKSFDLGSIFSSPIMYVFTKIGLVNPVSNTNIFLTSPVGKGIINGLAVPIVMPISAFTFDYLFGVNVGMPAYSFAIRAMVMPGSEFTTNAIHLTSSSLNYVKAWVSANLTKPLFNIGDKPVSALDILNPWGRFGEVGQMGLNLTPSKTARDNTVKLITSTLTKLNINSDLTPNTNSSQFQTIILHNPKSDTPTVRLFRGLQHIRDENFIYQAPYSARTFSVPGNPTILWQVKQESENLAQYPTYQHLLEYVDKVTPLLTKQEILSLRDTLTDIENDILRGYSVESNLAQLHTSYAAGAGIYGLSPYVAASTNPQTALKYAYDAILVLDIPLAQIGPQIVSHPEGELLIRGFIDPANITAVIIPSHDQLRENYPKYVSELEKITSQIPSPDNQTTLPSFSDIYWQKANKQDIEDVAQKRLSNLLNEFPQIPVNLNGFTTYLDRYLEVKNQIFDHYASRLETSGKGKRKIDDYTFQYKGQELKYSRQQVTDEMLLALKKQVEHIEKKDFWFLVSNQPLGIISNPFDKNLPLAKAADWIGQKITIPLQIKLGIRYEDPQGELHWKLPWQRTNQTQPTALNLEETIFPQNMEIINPDNTKTNISIDKKQLLGTIISIGSAPPLENSKLRLNNDNRTFIFRNGAWHEMTLYYHYTSDTGAIGIATDKMIKRGERKALTLNQPGDVYLTTVKPENLKVFADNPILFFFEHILVYFNQETVGLPTSRTTNYFEVFALPGDLKQTLLTNEVVLSENLDFKDPHFYVNPVAKPRINTSTPTSQPQTFLIKAITEVWNNLTKPLFNIRGNPVSALDILVPWRKFGEIGQMGLNPSSGYSQVEKKLDGIFDNTPSQTFINTVLGMQEKYGLDKTSSYLFRVKNAEIYTEMSLSSKEVLNQRSSPPSLDAELIIFLGTLDFGIPINDPDYARIQALKTLELADNQEIMAARTGLDVRIISQITSDSRQIAIDAFRKDFKLAYNAEVLPNLDLSGSITHVIFLTSEDMKRIPAVNGANGSANGIARVALVDAEYIKDLGDNAIIVGKYIVVHEFGHLLANSKWLIKPEMIDTRLLKNLEEARTIVFEMLAMGARGHYWSNYHSATYETARTIFVNKIIAKLYEVSPNRVTQLLNQMKLGDFSGVIDAFGGVKQFEDFLASPDIFGSQISITPETKITHPDGKTDSLGIDGAMYISRGDIITTADGRSFTLDQSVKVELSFGYSHTAADPNYWWTWNDDDGPIGIGTGMLMRINYLAVSPDYLPPRPIPTIIVSPGQPLGIISNPFDKNLPLARAADWIGQKITIPLQIALGIRYEDKEGNLHWKWPWSPVKQTVNTDEHSGQVLIANTLLKYELNNDGTGMLIYHNLSDTDLFTNIIPGIPNLISINGRNYLVSVSPGTKPGTLILSSRPFFENPISFRSLSNFLNQTKTSIAFRLGLPLHRDLTQNRKGTISVDNSLFQYELTNANNVVITNDSDGSVYILSPERPATTMMVNNQNTRFHASYNQNGKASSLDYNTNGWWLNLLGLLGLAFNGPACNESTYTVWPGDNLTKIAKRCNMTLDELIKLNNISDPNSIQIGQILIVSPNYQSPVQSPIAQSGNLREQNQTLIEDVANKYHVPRQYLDAIWGVENDWRIQDYAYCQQQCNSNQSCGPMQITPSTQRYVDPQKTQDICTLSGAMEIAARILLWKKYCLVNSISQPACAKISAGDFTGMSLEMNRNINIYNPDGRPLSPLIAVGRYNGNDCYPFSASIYRWGVKPDGRGYTYCDAVQHIIDGDPLPENVGSQRSHYEPVVQCVNAMYAEKDFEKRKQVNCSYLDGFENRPQGWWTNLIDTSITPADTANLLPPDSSQP